MTYFIIHGCDHLPTEDEFERISARLQVRRENIFYFVTGRRMLSHINCGVITYGAEHDKNFAWVIEGDLPTNKMLDREEFVTIPWYKPKEPVYVVAQHAEPLKPVIVFGPRGCGKTLNGETIQRYFGAERLVDTGKILSPPRWLCTNTVYLTNEPENLPAESGERRMVSYRELQHVIISNPKSELTGAMSILGGEEYSTPWGNWIMFPCPDRVPEGKQFTR